ncbi:MAG: M48 family metallopeptidase [Alphaproteobacteria bacterium]|nr:M48 family metallopeptidase [Alphaproteobacteria bacterium]
MACNKVPYTGRKQVNVVPGIIMNAAGKQSYAATLSEVSVMTTGDDHQTLTRVGKRISKVANEPKFDWQYSLIDDPTVNAWCLPGGYIGFYSGILPTLKNESGMAFVMGHEVGHAIAKHGAERMSQQIGVIGGLTVIQAWVDGKSKLTPEQKTVLFGALGLGAEVGVLLPFSRMHESEADVIGMMYMAEAGYPPEEAQQVWVRMGALGGEKPPVFLSTHPSEKQRIENLKKWLPQAKKKYARAKLPGDVTGDRW